MLIIKRLCHNKWIEMVGGGSDVHRPCAHQSEAPPRETISNGGDGLSEGEEFTVAVRREPGFET